MNDAIFRKQMLKTWSSFVLTSTGKESKTEEPDNF